MRFLSTLTIFIFLTSNPIFYITPLYAQEEGGDPEGGGGGFDFGGFDGGFGGFDFGGLGGGGPTETGGGPGGSDLGGGGAGEGAGSDSGGPIDSDDYGDPGAGNGSDNNDGSNPDGGNGIEGSDSSTDDSGNKVTLSLKADYFCTSGYIKLSWTAMENRQYRLYKDGTQVPGSPFAGDVLSFDDHAVTFAEKADIKYSLEYISVNKKGKEKVTDKIDVTALAPCAPPSVPVFTRISDRCVNSLPEVTIRWDKTDRTTYYEVWRSPTGITSKRDGSLLTYPDPHFGEGSNANKFSFNDPKNSVVVNQAPKQKTIYYYKIISVGPGAPDGRTPSNWVGLRTRQCPLPTVSLFLTANGITKSSSDVPYLTVKQNIPVTISWNTTDIPAGPDACTASIPSTNPIPSAALTSAWSNNKAEAGREALPLISDIGSYHFKLTCQNARGVDYTSAIILTVDQTLKPYFKTTGGDVHTNKRIYISQ
ncbi:hypothetical protein HYW44_04630 [Candidatus Daviesbacteria bacterium]|nr:hypothetical protein [Candidatus Daviesbacteria bacterium]